MCAEVVRGLGQWQGYVASGKTREERVSRLAEVPEDMRADVKRHVETIYAIKLFHKDRAKLKATKPMADINYL